MNRRLVIAKRDRRALLLGLAALVPLLLIVGLRSGMARFVAVRQELAVQRQLVRQERALLAAAAANRELSHRLQAAGAAAANRLLPATDAMLGQAELGSYMSRLSRHSNVLLQHLQPGATQTLPDGSSFVEVSVRGEGDFEGILAFLLALEAGQVLLHVRELGIETAASRPSIAGTEVLALRATVRGYLGLAETASASVRVPPMVEPHAWGAGEAVQAANTLWSVDSGARP